MLVPPLNRRGRPHHLELLLPASSLPGPRLNCYAGSTLVAFFSYWSAKGSFLAFQAIRSNGFHCNRHVVIALPVFPQISSFKPHNRGTLNGSAHYAIVNARVAKKSNSSRKMSEGTHFQRAQEKIVQEFFARHNQPNVSGDDMNIIQVGRPAVSR